MSDFPFRSGDLVLSEWHDGKLYYAYIQSVLPESGQCIVLFEDLDYYCVAYDKIHSVDEETSEIVCVICKEAHSDYPNEIVICDGCEYGWGFNLSVPISKGEAGTMHDKNIKQPQCLGKRVP